MRTAYFCEVCDEEFADAASAIACETRKVWIPPIGMVFGYSGSQKIVSAVIGIRPRVSHFASLQCYTCRDDGFADSVWGYEGSYTSEYGDKFGAPKAITDFHMALPCWRRLIDTLSSRGITPSIWDGEKVVPL